MVNQKYYIISKVELDISPSMNLKCREFFNSLNMIVFRNWFTLGSEAQYFLLLDHHDHTILNTNIVVIALTPCTNYSSLIIVVV